MRAPTFALLAAISLLAPTVHAQPAPTASPPASAAPPTSTGPSQEDRARANALMDDGDAKVASGDLAGALTSYETAHAIMRVPSTGIEVAKTLDKLGKLLPALAAAREVADRRGASLVVALGDMLELGPLTESEHRAIVREADGVGAAALILAGPELGRAAEAEKAALETLYWAYSSSVDAAEALGEVVGKGDVLLVKGSRGTRMERLIEALESEETKS